MVIVRLKQRAVPFLANSQKLMEVLINAVIVKQTFVKNVKLN